MAYDELDYRGNYTVTVSVAYIVLTTQYGDGYEDSAIIGSLGGLRSWALTYSALHRYPFGVGAPQFVSQSRADYLYQFYCAKLAAGNEPFILFCPYALKRFLVKFADTSMTLTLMDTRLATASTGDGSSGSSGGSGVNLKQVRVAGVTDANADGSL
jgi:hypothetical protein